LEDVPGVGKTTLAKTLAEVFGLDFKRVQFSADMLPSDIIGVNFFDISKKEFVFKKGPIFTEIFLADELNRATPKAQSALLEAMEERQVSVDGITYFLPDDFFVIATQNPNEHGIYPLPLSQLDRFGISISIGYPQREFEKQILKSQEVKLKDFKEEISFYKQKAKEIFVDEKIYDLILDLGDISRRLFSTGLSTRALLSLLDISKAYAMINERDFVIDEDIFTIFKYVSRHRLERDGYKKIIYAYYKS